MSTKVDVVRPDAVTGAIHMPLAVAPTDYEKNEARLEQAEFVTANLFFRKEVIRSLGGFDERFRMAWREDSDLHFRVIKAGYRLVHSELPLVVHPIRPAPWAISVRQQRKTMFDPLLYKKHRKLYRQRIRRYPPLLYYAIVSATVAGIASAAADHKRAAALCGLLSAGLIARFCLLRFVGTSHAPRHVAEMVVTSMAIPFLSIFWRLYGR